MKILTFGYRYKRDAPVGADIVFDARCLKEDPAEKTKLGPLTGKDKAVEEYLCGLPDVELFTRATTYAVQSCPSGTVVAVACHSGRHRSVFIAEAVGRVLGIPVEHLDMLRSPTEDCAPDIV